MATIDHVAELERKAAEIGVTGASFAYWDGERMTLATTGLRNSRTGDPVTADTILHIGSITKILNATLVMQLVDDGLIDLDDPVRRHLPRLRVADMAALEAITCRMLLNHTSGLNGDMFRDHGPDQERIADVIARCADVGQLHPPGGGPAYCNIATVIAGHLAETLRGQSWYTLARERLFEPLDMSHAIVELNRLPLFRASVGDLTDFETGELVQTTRPFLALGMAPCGTTAMMTADDLATFGRALVNDGVGPNGARILSAASARLMAEPTVATVVPEGAAWGLGWFIRPDGVLRHSGGGPGVASSLYVHPPSGRVAVLLTNCDRGGLLDAEVMGPLVQDWTGVEPSRPQAQPAPADLSPFEGVFGNQMSRAYLRVVDGQLTVAGGAAEPLYDNQVRPTPPVPLTATGPGRFAALRGSRRPVSEYVFVEPGADGRMGGLFTNPHYLARLD